MLNTSPINVLAINALGGVSITNRGYFVEV